MAKTEYIDLLPSQTDQYYSNLTPQDRFQHGRVTKKFVFYSRKRKKGLSARSLLPIIAEAWATLSEAEKTAWTAAAAECGLNGWRLFVQDMCARIYNDIAGIATPSTYHQSWVGNLKIEDPAIGIKIIQLHPRFYWVYRKVSGKKGMYEPVKTTEDLALPLEISLNYKSDLEGIGFGDAIYGVYYYGGALALFYAEVWRRYQGVDYFQNLEINLDLSCPWQNASASLDNVVGQLIAYNLYFDLSDVVGDLYFDNVRAIHSGQNWVRDTNCKDILQGFTRAFYQIPKHWAGVTVPAGSQYDSVYKDF